VQGRSERYPECLLLVISGLKRTRPYMAGTHPRPDIVGGGLWPVGCDAISTYEDAPWLNPLLRRRSGRARQFVAVGRGDAQVADDVETFLQAHAFEHRSADGAYDFYRGARPWA
jgi:hypothetical protein